nr:hypothetical protein [Mycolicibacterium tusciae]
MPATERNQRIRNLSRSRTDALPNNSDVFSAAESGPAQAKFRADIEGLRAVAVLAVVLFHAAVPGIGGGYIGVDVVACQGDGTT